MEWKRYKHYFWRGLIDGDGCFYYGKKGNYQFCIASSFQQDWSATEDLFKELNIFKYSINRRSQKRRSGKYHNYSTIATAIGEGITKLGNYIYKGYPNDKIGFKRKYNKFIKIKESTKNKRHLKT